MSEESGERVITLTIRRPYALTDWGREGPFAGSTIPVGASIAVIATDNALLADVQAVNGAGLVGCVTSPEELLQAAAEVSCPHLMSQTCDCSGEYPCSHPDWFGCRRYDDENLLVCLGDMSKCPFEEERATAAARKALGIPKGGE